MKVPIIDLKAQYEKIQPDIDKAINEVLESQYFILGPTVEAFERAISDYLGVKHAIGVASGTDALQLSLMALGIETGDEVIVPVFSFFATAEVISLIGAKPVFADISPDTFNVTVETLEKALTPKTKAIIVVHLFGQITDMDEIRDFAASRNLFLVEDAAQAIGAKYKDKHAGRWGDFAAFSFFPTKNLGGFGDGGLVTTDNTDLAEHCLQLRVHGQSGKYLHSRVGLNSRLDAIQAAVLRAKLSYLDKWTEMRRENADRYRKLLKDKAIKLPIEHPDCYHNYHQFTILTDRREELQKYLASQQVGSAIYYPLPMSLQPCYKSLNYQEGDFPVAEQISRKCLSLPIFPELGEERQQFVAQKIIEFLDRM